MTNEELFTPNCADDIDTESGTVEGVITTPVFDDAKSALLLCTYKNSINDSNKVAVKTPVDLLHELFDKRDIVSKYDLIQIEGTLHQPIFKYRLTVGQVIVTGCGQSKQKAKQSAAKSMLDKLVEAKESGLTDNAEVAVADLIRSLITTYQQDDGIQGNPVGLLQEMCRTHRMPPAIFNFNEQGLAHERSFSVECILEYGHRLTTTGCGRSKKLAKRYAANEMIKKVKELPCEIENISKKMGDELASERLGTLYSQANTNNSRTIQTKPVKIALQNKKGESLSKLQHIDLSKEWGIIDCLKMLRKIGKEQQFKLTFVDVEKISKKGNYQCMVQLCLLPVAVCFGEGKDRFSAKQAAAKDALNYLKLMTCKKRSILI